MKKERNIRPILATIGIFLFTIFLYMKNNILFINSIINNDINLSLAEIDTEYENNESYDLLNSENHFWAWPTNGDCYLTSTYSYHHPAIDIVTNGNYDVYSSYSGYVITNSYKYDNGNYLVIKQDNGYYTMYAHLSQKLVDQGQRVKKGQLIGIMGRTGFATGVHLHFAVWDGTPHQSNSFNPLSFY